MQALSLGSARAKPHSDILRARTALVDMLTHKLKPYEARYGMGWASQNTALFAKFEPPK